MKKIVMPLLTLVITLGLVIPAARGDHFIGHFKGLGAEAHWSMYDEDTGVYTDVYIYAVDRIYRTPPQGGGGWQYANISIYQYLYDADEYVPIRDIYCWADPIPGTLVVDGNLTWASLTASGIEGWQYDYDTGEETAITIDVDVSWSGTGPMSNYHSNYHFRYPYGFYNSHSTGKSRQASSLGEVVLDGTGLTLQASDYAEVFSSKEGSVEVYR